MAGSSSGFSLPEYLYNVSMSVGIAESCNSLYSPRSHLLSPPIMFKVVSLTEDIVASMFQSKSMIIPVGTLICRLNVHMSPHLWGGCDKDIRRHPCNRSFAKMSEPSNYAVDIREILTICFAYIGIPVVAIWPEQCPAMQEI